MLSVHGGTCSDIQGLVSYRCACPGGYAGQNCDQDSTAALANYNTLTTVLVLAAQSDSAEENNANGDVTTDSAVRQQSAVSSQQSAVSSQQSAASSQQSAETLS